MNLDTAIWQTLPITKTELGIYFTAIYPITSNLIKNRWVNRKSSRKNQANEELATSLIHLIINNKILGKDEIKALKIGLSRRYDINCSDLDSLQLSLDKSISMVFTSPSYSRKEKAIFCKRISMHTLQQFSQNDLTENIDSFSLKKWIIEVLKNIAWIFICVSIPLLLYSFYLVYTTETLHLADFITLETLILYLMILGMIIISSFAAEIFFYIFKVLANFITKKPDQRHK